MSEYHDLCIRQMFTSIQLILKCLHRADTHTHVEN